ncbi:hypothetical protein NCCP2495_05350 [Dietzia sp. NCCP-2495]|uniref:HNH endonuclease n=1 Tax=Dietzia sp. NCCP-2495 TaxID=2934675 RepID=UPI002230BBED|nr:HNH endonuclease [Dietzia sp. NCCP-2495]GLB62657.1 hypothetical protein NCCP2495_05350 [Dietzia sp. NCCP-2495]
MEEHTCEADEAVKVCTRCNESKMLAEFHKDASKRDGRRTACKVCVRHRERAYREANRDKKIAYMRVYNSANRDRINASNAARYEANRDSRLAWQKDYHERNGDAVREQRKTRRREEPDLVRARDRAYYETHRKKKLDTRKANHKRRWEADPEYRAKRNADSVRRRRMLSAAKQEPYTRESIFERDQWVCQLCDEPIDPGAAWPDPGTPSIDHVVPLSLGGDDTPRNTQAAHMGCNSSKGNRIVA